MGPLRVSGGRHRTNPFSCSQAKHTTSRWASRTNCFRRSATKRLAAFLTPLLRTRSTSRLLPRLQAIRTRRSSQTSKPLPTSCGCWPHPHSLPRPARKDASLLQGLVVSTAILPRLPRAQRSRAAPRPARALRFPIRRRIFTPTFSAPTWAKRLTDGITQGGAGPDEFRTAPLWGVGQRIFFLHDGRTNNLVEAISAHKGPGSEANKVIERFNRLSTPEKQDLINFLRSL